MRSINIDIGFSAQTLGRVLTEKLNFPADVPLCVAYSGGMDSHVLLHALARLRTSHGFGVRAVHVDHGLQPASGAWAQHCATICTELDIPCVIDCIEVNNKEKVGLEAAARRARYASFARLLEPGEVLLTAHHQDDQAETLMLQLLRGTGLPGLAGMTPLVAFAAGRLARPLLFFSRQTLERYARAERLHWIEDPSNRDLRHGRNLLRHKVFPVLATRWPTLHRQLGRAARHVAEAADLLEQVARDDLAGCRVDTGVQASRLVRLPLARQRNALRHWIRESGFQVPSTALVERALALAARMPRTRHAMIRWGRTALYRYRDLLMLHPADSVSAVMQEGVVWDGKGPLVLSATRQRLRLMPVHGAGLARARLEGTTMQVRFRQGGERCRLPGHAHRHKLKKLLQAAGVPPWERARIPLLYVNDELAAVADRWVCEPYAARATEPGLALVLESVMPEITPKR